MDVVYVLDAGLGQVTHLERDLNAALDVLEGRGLAHPGVAVLGKLHFHGLVFLGPYACRQGYRQSRKLVIAKAAPPSLLARYIILLLSFTCRYTFIGDAAHDAGTRTTRTVPYVIDDHCIPLTQD